MAIKCIGSNVVIAAKQFNPSILSQLWLVKHQIIAENEFEPNLVITDVMVQVATKQFQLIAVPEQFQFAPAADEANAASLIQDKIGKIVSNLSHTPYTGIGMNFLWHLIPEEEVIPALTRKIFFRENIDPFKSFDTADAHFGGYMSKNIFGGRLKLDIRPVKSLEKSIENGKSFLMFAFNFHRDIKGDENPVASINEFLTHWNDAQSEAERIIKSIETYS